MEKRLVKIIMNPSIIATWLFGFLMIMGNVELLSYEWMHVKLTGIVAMTGLHGFFTRCQKNFEHNKNKYSEKFYRIWNEVPIIITTIIVIMAIVEPF